VNGRKIKIVEDDACDPKQAVTVANRVVGEQIKSVDSHACSGSSIPVSEVYAENNILMMSSASSNPVLTENGHPTIMRLYTRDDARGTFIGPRLAEKFKSKKIAIVHDKSAYGKGFAAVVKDKLNAAGVNEVVSKASARARRTAAPSSPSSRTAAPTWSTSAATIRKRRSSCATGPTRAIGRR
jgi:branched-chain amino acid transport system substrate-binding protein